MRASIVPSNALCLASVAAILVVLTAVPAGQRRGETDNSAEGVPVATNAIVQDTAAYYGKSVTISAAVEKVLSKTAFAVDQRRVVRGEGVKGFGAPILVIAPSLTGAIKPADYLLIRGEIVKFEPANLARVAPDYAPDLPAETYATYSGGPVLIAKSVKDSQYVELAKQP